MHIFARYFLLLFGMLSFGLVTARQSSLAPVRLRVEHMDSPTTLDTQKPRLAWVCQPCDSTSRNLKQTAYQICVATSKADLKKKKRLVWDSGKVISSNSYLIPYSGTTLQSGQDYWWSVRVWDQNDNASEWSDVSHWGMGLLNESDWKAQWIGSPDEVSAPLFRKEFSTHRRISQAKVFICGLGYFELYLNGRRVGDDYLVPNFTNYTSRPHLTEMRIPYEDNFTDYRVLYLSYDVTEQLKQGRNAIGVILGNGFYNCVYSWVATFGKPCLLAQLEITYQDGTHETIATDLSWRTHSSAILKNGPYIGELYDAKQENTHWTEPNFKETQWTAVSLATKPIGKLSAQSSPADKITQILQPQNFKALPDGSFEVDFGEEISGWIRVKQIQGQAGDTLNIKYICESPLGIHQYVFKDNQPVTYAPRFTWYVFRKAIITGVQNLTAQQLQAEAVNTDVPLYAQFSCSNPLFNQIEKIWQRSQMDNMHGCIASDCPHRERSPYTGDGQAACAMVMHNFDAAAFYNKWLRDMRDAQDKTTGYVPNGAPWQSGCGGGVAWGAAMNIIPWEYYLQYGDRQALVDNYLPMRRQADQMLQWLQPDSTMLQEMKNIKTGKTQIWFNLGDWAPAFQLPPTGLVHTFYLWLCFHNTALTDQVLGYPDEAQHYEQIAESVKRAFHKTFYDAKAKTYPECGGNVYALYMGVPAERLNDVRQALRREIMEKYKGHINTGFLATRYFFEVLAENGMDDVAITVLSQKDFPSYGYWIAQGATTTWEQWNGKDSRNHPMFGGGLVWFYRYLVGLRIDPAQPAYRHMIVEPHLTNALSHASYALETPYGKASVRWKKVGEEYLVDVTVPVGASATVILPSYTETVGQGHYQFRTH